MSGRHSVPSLTVRQATAIALCALSGLTAALTLIDMPTPARLYLTVAFVILAPGWALTAYLRIEQPALVWSASVSIGVALVLVVAQTMVSAGFWHPWAAMLALELGTVGILVHHLIRWRTPKAVPALGAPG